MRGIPKDEVVRFLTEHGAQVLDIALDESAGPASESFRYLVKRSSSL